MHIPTRVCLGIVLKERSADYHDQCIHYETFAFNLRTYEEEASYACKVKFRACLQVDRSLLEALEANAEEAIGGNNWSQKLEHEFLANLGKYRKYQPSSLRDLLRVVRNKHNHFREMPEELQSRIGRTPEQYFR